MDDRSGFFTSVKDDGQERQTFANGAIRESMHGKGRFDLIPPIALLRLAQHYENGASATS